MSEFELIQSYFKPLQCDSEAVDLGIGDDCALLRCPAGYRVASSVDTLVAGTHFFPSMPAEQLGYKCLAVNLSDLAAMGAKPAWFTLALTMPEVDTDWLAAFVTGLSSLANQYSLPLVGGDTTRGPLSITIQVQGLLPINDALCRHGAQIGDGIYVSGTLGDAAAGLQLTQQAITAPPRSLTVAEQYAISRFTRPSPRVGLGQALLPIANAAIDISDGLIADLQHILTASGVGAELQQQAIPLSTRLQDAKQRYHDALYGGEDYELCYTVAKDKQQQLESLPFDSYRIGTIIADPILKLYDERGRISVTGSGYDHFR